MGAGVEVEAVLRVEISLRLRHAHIVTLSHRPGRAPGRARCSFLLLLQPRLGVEGGGLLHGDGLVAGRTVRQDLQSHRKV